LATIGGTHLVPPGKDPVVTLGTGGHRLRQLVHNRHVSVVALLTTFRRRRLRLVARLRDRHVVRAGNRRGRALTGFVVTPFDPTRASWVFDTFGPTATSAALTGLNGRRQLHLRGRGSNGVATGPSTSSNSVAVVPSSFPRWRRRRPEFQARTWVLPSRCCSK